MKRLISLLLVLTLCVGMLPAPAWAEEEPTDPTQAVEEVETTEPGEETEPTTEPTEEETTEATEEGTTEAAEEPTEEEPTEASEEKPTEETEPTEEETEATEVQTLEEPVGEVAVYEADSAENVAMLEAGGEVTYYTSLNEAIEAATTAGKVTLLTDAVLENTPEDDCFWYKPNAGTDLTIVLAGHTLAGEFGCFAKSLRFTIDGSETGSIFSGRILFQGPGSVLTINGGTYEKNTKEDYVLCVAGRAQLNITAGEFKDCFKFNCSYDNGGYIPLNVTGGTFDKGITCEYGTDLTLCRRAPYCFTEDGRKIKLSDLGLSTDRTLTVAECTEHTYETDETQENCEYCGKRNPQKPPENAVATVDGEFYSTLLGAIQAANTSGKTVVLYKDQRLPDDEFLRLDSYTVTIDLNGKELAVQQGLPILVTGGNVTLTNSQPTGKIAASGNSGSAIEVQGGSLTVGENVRVEGVSYGGLVYPAIVVDEGTVTLHQGATLVNGIQAPEGHTIAEYLAEGNAYSAGGQVTNGYVQETTETLTVVQHSHSFLGGGKCDCGKETTAQLDAGGIRYYFDDFTSAINEAKKYEGSTVTLLQNVTLTGNNNIYIDSGTFTIDWQGHTLSGETWKDILVVTKTANVTLKNSVGTGGVCNAGTMSGAAIGINVDSNGSLTIHGGVYSPQVHKYRNAYGSIQISGGVFENPASSGQNFALYCETGVLADLLAPGYTLAYRDNGELFNVYGVNKPDVYRSVCVVEHPTHELDDETDTCACGFHCEHKDVGDDGVCTACGNQMAASVTAGDGSVTYYRNIADAITAATASSGTTVTLLDDIGETITNSDKDFTLDLNGKTLAKLELSGVRFALMDSQQTGTIEQLYSEYYVYTYLKEGWCLVDADGMSLDLLTRLDTSDPIQVVYAGVVDVERSTKGTVSYGQQKLPFSLRFRLEDGLEVSAVKVSWTYEVAVDEQIGSVQTLTKGEDGFYIFDASKPLEENPLDYEHLGADLTHVLLSQIELKREDGQTRSLVLSGYNITSKKANLSDAEITLDSTPLTYAPDPQTAVGQEQTKTVTSVTLYGNTLAEGADYEVTGNTGTNAGTYTLTVSAKADSKFYTGSKTVTWEIKPLEISGLGFDDLSKTYDGNTQAKLTGVYFLEGTQNICGVAEGKDYRVLKVGDFASADVHRDDQLIVEVELLGGNYLYNGTSRVESSALASIEPAKAPTPAEGSFTIRNGSEATYTMDDLGSWLTEPEEPCTYGTVTIGTPDVDIKVQGYTMTARIENGDLKLNVTGTGDVEDFVALVTVPVTTRNYGTINLIVGVYAKDKTVPVVREADVSEIVYGQKLEESRVISFRAYEPDGMTPVSGTLRWEKPETVPEAGKPTMKMIFTPEDSIKYAETPAWVAVQVNKRPVTLSGVTVKDKTYDGKTDAEVDSKGTFSGVVSGDTMDYTVTAAFENKNVVMSDIITAASKPVTLTVTLNGDTAKNYTLAEDSQKETTATITPKEVDVTGGFTAQDRDYEPQRDTVMITKGTVTFVGKLDGDDLDAETTLGVADTPNAGQNKRVSYLLVLNGADKNNYTVGSKPVLTVTIRPIAQTLAFADATVTKTYGDAPFANALDHSAGDGDITYTSGNPAVATVAADGTVTIHGAGTAKITATAGATQNYVETAASFDLTVDKARGVLENKNYSLEYTYGDAIPKPSRENFETNSTGAFSYQWEPSEPKNAGTYQLAVTVEGDDNHTAASWTRFVTVRKSTRSGPSANVDHHETVAGKKDGAVTLPYPAALLEYRVKGDAEYGPVPASASVTYTTVSSLASGTYEFRLKETENYVTSDPAEVIIQPGRMLTVTLPSPQTGYSLTAGKTELGWQDSLKLTLTVAEGYYKTASFALKAGDRVLTEDNGTYTLTNVEDDVIITLEGVEKDEKAPSLILRNWTFGQGVFQGLASCKEWKNISTATDPYFVISTRGNYFTVEASDGETGLTGAYYLLSNTALTQEALEKAAWEPVPEESLNQGNDLVQEKMIQLVPGEWYFYVKAVDKAGNAAYVGSQKLIREENAPTFTGVIDEATYYTTQKVTITDDYALSRYLAPGSKKWKNISGTTYEVTLEGNREATYTMKVEDACQNTSTLTVYMRPISDLTEDIQNLTSDNIQKSDYAKLTQAENALKALDTANATDEEKKTIADALDNIARLKVVLEEVTRVETAIDALPDTVEPWDAEAEKNVKAARAAYDSLTDHQKSMVDDSKLTKLAGFTAGANQSWALGSGKDLRFSVNGQLAKVKEVRLNGQAVDADMTAQAKGTDFVLKARNLQILGVGSYTLQVNFTDGQPQPTQVTVTVSPNYLDLMPYPEFGFDPTVTVDGRTYPTSTDGGFYVNLPETGDYLQRFDYQDFDYSSSHGNYPTGMTTYRIHRQEGGATLERIDALDNLLIYAGCSIRISGKQGIRMITGISEANKKALTSKAGLAGYTLEEYGTLVCWNTDVTSGDDFSLDMACARSNYAYKKGKADPVFGKENGNMLYTNVLVGFSLEECAKDLVLRPYIKLKDTATGETVTLYGGSVCRSIGYIARQNADTYKPGSSGYKYVHNIIDAVYGQEP